MDTVTIKDLSKVYGEKTALAPTSLELAPGSLTAIVGKSGCGKTTLLRLLAGLEEPTTGTVTGLPAKVAPVFQEPRLMPWLTVADNITLAAANDPSLAKSKDRLADLLNVLELTGASALYPSQLSGGMAQRVSLGRTLFYNPELILMDEPFSALDYFTRRSLQQMLLRLFRNQTKTIVFVTHDVEEALLLGDRVLVMEEGAIKSALPVTLPHPRSATSPQFQKLRETILTLLK